MRFHKPDGWQGRTVADSPIVNSGREVWQSLESVYLEELPDLAYKEIPPADEIEKSIQRLLTHLK